MSLRFVSLRSVASAPTLLAGLLLASASAFAHVTVEAPWARATAPGQSATGAFMVLKANHDMQLVGVRSPVAGVAEVHEMAMDGQVMKMRAIPSLALPAGKAVSLKPGGHHIMLMDLKAPLAAGTKVPLTLLLRDAKGAESQMEVTAVAQPMGAAAAAGASSGAGAGAHAGHGAAHSH